MRACNTSTFPASASPRALLGQVGGVPIAIAGDDDAHTGIVPGALAEGGELRVGCRGRR
jgi:hypothetical protein